MNQTPLFPAHQARGAELEVYGDWMLAARYSPDLAPEISALTQTAALLDLAEIPTVVLQGPDARRFCNGMFTNNIRDLQPGQSNRSAACDDRGRVQALLDIHCTGEDAFLAVLEGVTSDWFEERYGLYIVFDDVEMSAYPEAPWVLSVQGPKAAEVLAAAGLPTPESGHIQVGDGIRVCAKNRAGTGGFDLLIPADALDATFEALAGAGATPTGRDALDAVRISQGRAAWPQDGTEKSLVHELRIEGEVCSFTKGCYLGQEVINRVDVKGQVNKRLTGLVLEEDAVPPIGAEIQLGDAVVGKVSSTARLDGRVLALSVMRKAAWDADTQVQILSGDRTVAARVAELPLQP